MSGFVLQRRTAAGWRRFLVDGQATQTSARLTSAMRFATAVEADFYRLRFGLWDFEVVQAVDDDHEAERAEFQKNRTKMSHPRKDRA